MKNYFLHEGVKYYEGDVVTVKLDELYSLVVGKDVLRGTIRVEKGPIFYLRPKEGGGCVLALKDTAAPFIEDISLEVANKDARKSEFDHNGKDNKFPVEHWEDNDGNIAAVKCPRCGDVITKFTKEAGSGAITYKKFTCKCGVEGKMITLKTKEGESTLDTLERSKDDCINRLNKIKEDSRPKEEEKPRQETLSEKMEQWRKKNHNRYASNEIFWEEFFKEMKRLA